MLLKNAQIVTMNENLDVLENMDILIEDNIIKKIGKNLEVNDEEIIDCSGKLVTPGLINSHTHLPMSLFRTLGEEDEDRLTKFVFPIEGKFITPANVETATKFTMLEMIAAGTTTVCDMYYYDYNIAKVLSEIGMRAVLGETIIDQGGETFNTELGRFEHLEKLVDNYLNSELIVPAVAPHAPYTNSLESLKKCFEYSVKHDIPQIIHVSEMVHEIGEFRNERSPIEYLDKHGLLNEKTILIHMIYVDDKDLEIVKKRKCSIVHNPISNAKGGREIMNYKLMREKGITVGLGTDGQMSGNLGDMQSTLNFVNKIQKYKEKNRSFLSAVEIFKLATIDGAKTLGLDKEIGSIEIGKKADLLVIDYQTPNMFPMYEIYSGLVNGLRPSNIKYTIVNGKVLYENSKFKTLDYDEVFNEFKVLVKEISDFCQI